jgi:acyl-coenzyme A thioesterase PaaI-like protein
MPAVPPERCPPLGSGPGLAWFWQDRRAMETPWMVYPDPDLDARRAAAEALRRLAAALVSRRVGPVLLAEVTASAAALAVRVEAGEPLPVREDYQARRYLDPPPPDGTVLVSMSERPFSGPANPGGFDLVIRRQGDDVVGVVTLDRRAEASPGRAHGGVIAGLFDDVMGYVNTVASLAAYTRDLTVRYLAPFPLGVPVTIWATMTEREDRRCTVSAVATSADGTVVGEATARFAIVPPDRFGL